MNIMGKHVLRRLSLEKALFILHLANKIVVIPLKILKNILVIVNKVQAPISSVVICKIFLLTTNLKVILTLVGVKQSN